MEMDLQIKVDRYEAKAAKCSEAAAKAGEGAQRTLYEELARYYGGLASDFRRAIEKRNAA
jgi:hypothetical protein